MSMCEHIRMMAQYNEWMNTRLYEAALALPAEEMFADKGAFFGSLYGTLNHIALGDTIWLKRFATHPAGHAALDPVRALPMPATLDARDGSIDALRDRRAMLDAVIGQWAAELNEDDLGALIKYTRLNGTTYAKPFGPLVMHFFNHQTHHRGQATTLLSQCGVDMGSTDLLMLVPDA